MRQAGNASRTSSVRALLGSVVAAYVCAGLMASCSSSTPHTARHAVTTAHQAASPTTTTTTSPRTTTTIASPSVTYRVKLGDRLTTIAKRLHISVPAIVFANHLTNPDRLREGQVLKLPGHPPVALVVTPPRGAPGQRFQLDLIGSKPSEVIRFIIASPAGKHAGPAHIASKDGAITTKYKTSPSDRAGTYKVVVTGNKGTKAQASFVVIKHP
ncbi:MAG: LysM peptidoglycan-binding domain-containing protein [Actinomycetota bacterium]|nr:LysM peptidoglycan-binding domain-containing protein [Actinomycetota bacterium]